MVRKASNVCTYIQFVLRQNIKHYTSWHVSLCSMSLAELNRTTFQTVQCFVLLHFHSQPEDAMVGYKKMHAHYKTMARNFLIGDDSSLKRTPY
jgi:predicted esterase YcpF (UPF0227 family)